MTNIEKCKKIDELVNKLYIIKTRFLQDESHDVKKEDLINYINSIY